MTYRELLLQAELKLDYEDITLGEFEQMIAPLNREVDVLDKIRAEINQYGSIWVQYQIKGHTGKDIEDIIEDVLKQAKEQVLSVIDKYRNEVSHETE